MRLHPVRLLNRKEKRGDEKSRDEKRSEDRRDERWKCRRKNRRQNSEADLSQSRFNAPPFRKDSILISCLICFIWQNRERERKRERERERERLTATSDHVQGSTKIIQSWFRYIMWFNSLPLSHIKMPGRELEFWSRDKNLRKESSMESCSSIRRLSYSIREFLGPSIPERDRESWELIVKNCATAELQKTSDLECKI